MARISTGGVPMDTLMLYPPVMDVMWDWIPSKEFDKLLECDREIFFLKYLSSENDR